MITDHSGLHWSASINHHPITAGDGVAATEESRLVVTASVPSEVLLFDLV
ncbi:MAG: pirin family protein [Planctomycetota bacterium]